MLGERYRLFHSLTFALVVAAMLVISGCSGPATQGMQASSVPVNDTPSGQGQQVTDAPPTGDASANHALSELTPEAFAMSEWSPYVKFFSPREDDETNGTISVSGIFTDKNITSALISVDNETGPVAVVNGSFRTTVNISGPAEIVLSAVDANGTNVSGRIVLDGDRLPAPYERICGFDPLNPDSDGLKDGFEVKIASDPLKSDSDDDGVPDIDERHTYPFSQDWPRVDIAITGKGDIIAEFRAGNETSEYYTEHPAGRGPLIRIFPNDCVESMDVTLPYPDDIVSPGNLAIVYYNDTIGMFLPVDSIVDEPNRTVRGHLDMRDARPSRWGDLMVRVFDVQALYDLNLEIAVFNAPLAAYMPEDKVVRIETRDTVNISVISRGTDGRQAVTGRTLRFLPTESEVGARL